MNSQSILVDSHKSKSKLNFGDIAGQFGVRLAAKFGDRICGVFGFALQSGLSLKITCLGSFESALGHAQMHVQDVRRVR